MALAAYNGFAPIAGSTVTVYDTGTLDLVTLYADLDETVLANPFTADEATGGYLFYADDDGDYDIVTHSAEAPTMTIPGLPVVIFSGEGENRLATLVVVDPDTDEQVILSQIGGDDTDGRRFVCPGGDTLPTTCEPRDLFVRTGATDPGLYVCVVADAWVGPLVE